MYSVTEEEDCLEELRELTKMRCEDWRWSCARGRFGALPNAAATASLARGTEVAGPGIPLRSLSLDKIRYKIVERVPREKGGQHTSGEARVPAEHGGRVVLVDAFLLAVHSVASTRFSCIPQAGSPSR